MSRSTTIKLPVLDLSATSPRTISIRGRPRSASIVKVEEVGDRSIEESLDRSAYVNINANWVNAKGAWLIHVVLIFFGKLVFDTIPGMTQQISWTAVNLFYLALSYLMFHWVTGIPFENDLHGGAYDDLTLWEQIDDGAQYTPAKKWLFSVPIGLFLASTHYTNYNPWLFAINLTALIFVLIPKLPQLHRQRVRFMSEDLSGTATPITPSFPPSGIQTPLSEKSNPSDITEAHFH
ncbi:putative ORMDL family protein [Lyophyllum shimeji]|uniref:ORMDL family protein n=1 Tax=Lyophyllum shimeji TaxID=47721 RepID=A0A9P3PEU2_LYOSH|nr:putative ORMDL family protein [Lyophyllum shimeji]